MRNNFSVLNVYKKKSKKSKIVTQLLFGDNFKVLKKKKSWLKIKNYSDNYIGFVYNKNFSKDCKNTHKICVLSTNIYKKPNTNSKIVKKLSFGSKIKVIKKNGSFYQFDNFWVRKKNLKKINFKNNDIFKNIKKFVNVKYKWGGKHFSGIDCSGLVQLFFNYNNRFCPRDSGQQLKFFKKKVKLKNIKKNDLIFWKGHVAIVLDKTRLIHAYGPFKKVIIMPIKKTIGRIYKTADLKVIGIKI